MWGLNERAKNIAIYKSYKGKDQSYYFQKLRLTY